MQPLPFIEDPIICPALVVRADFADDAAWQALCVAIQTPTPVNGFQAHVHFVDDPQYAGLTAAQAVELASAHTFLFIADGMTFALPDRPILVVDLKDEPGRTFRVIPGRMWAVENNLSISNADFADFAGCVDPDGIFRDDADY